MIGKANRKKLVIIITTLFLLILPWMVPMIIYTNFNPLISAALTIPGIFYLVAIYNRWTYSDNKKEELFEELKKLRDSNYKHSIEIQKWELRYNDLSGERAKLQKRFISGIKNLLDDEDLFSEKSDKIFGILKSFGFDDLEDKIFDRIKTMSPEELKNLSKENHEKL